MEDIIVEVEQGKLRGKADTNYNGGNFYTFHGIPYAKPPINELRFKAPQPPDSWEGIRDATKEGNECFGRHFLDATQFVGSEDCLFLNVFTQQLPNESTELKPVLFWIHGGGFRWGSSKVEWYGPELMMTEDIVLVTINYRLGIFGFLQVEDPVSGTVGNAAFKDMVMALKWVQKNIKKFGGDPNCVTVFGESAGSASAHSLVLSPMAKGLFHRAILQSGAALSSWMLGNETTLTVAKALGYESTDAGDVLKYLQSLSSQQIFECQEKFLDDFECDHKRPFGTTIENSSVEPTFYSKYPWDIVQSGEYNKVPIIIGYTNEEGLLIEMEQFQTLKNFNYDFEKKIPYYLNVPKGSELSLKIAKMIKENYYGSSEPSDNNMKPLYNLETDIIFCRGIYKSVLNHMKTMDEPIYFYRFSFNGNHNFLKKLMKRESEGACHGDDLGYQFTTTYLPPIPKNSPEELTMRRMMKMWTNFARTGNPTPDENDPDIGLKWLPVDDKELHCLEIGKELELTEYPDLDRIKIWDEISALVAKENH